MVRSHGLDTEHNDITSEWLFEGDRFMALVVKWLAGLFMFDVVNTCPTRVSKCCINKPCYTQPITIVSITNRKLVCLVYKIT